MKKMIGIIFFFALLVGNIKAIKEFPKKDKNKTITKNTPNILTLSEESIEIPKTCCLGRVKVPRQLRPYTPKNCTMLEHHCAWCAACTSLFYCFICGGFCLALFLSILGTTA